MFVGVREPFVNVLDDQGCPSEWEGDGAQFTIANKFVGSLWGATCGDERVAGCSCSLVEIEVVLEGEMVWEW